jgi:hypothetical protein
VACVRSTPEAKKLRAEAKAAKLQVPPDLHEEHNLPIKHSPPSLIDMRVLTEGAPARNRSPRMPRPDQARDGHGPDRALLASCTCLTSVNAGILAYRGVRQAACAPVRSHPLPRLLPCHPQMCTGLLGRALEHTGERSA